MKRSSFLIYLFIFMGLWLTACQDKKTSSGNPEERGQLPPPSTVGKMTVFSNKSELESYLKDQFAKSPIPQERYEIPINTVANSDSAGAPASGLAAESFSQTNIQEQGVDESDKVKTDGRFFYIAQNQNIQILQALPDDAMKMISNIKVDGQVDTLYLFNKILIALYTPTEGSGQPWDFTRVSVMPATDMLGLPFWLPVKAETGVLAIDISDPANPEHIQNTVVEGNLAASRRVNGKLHLVVRFLPELPPLQLTYDGTDEDFKRVVAKNNQALSGMTLDDLLPHYKIIGSDNTPIQTGPLLEWQDLYRPVLEGGASLVTVITFDLEQASIPFHSVGLVADIHALYSSTKAIYLTATHWKKDAIPTDLDEPQYDLRQSTMIHKLDISADKVIPSASGFVWGRILNQFSLGEHEDILRIATTTGFGWGSRSTSRNHLFTLQASGENLNIIGKIENIAPGESIYSARFIGERGFLVTFVKVDPLFTIDLSDPKNPKIAGELKVPGYSDYIHPLGENHLMTIGKDAKEENGTTWYQGMQLSIFDITDFANPKLLHQEKLGDRGTESEALHNHKAFTFWTEEGLLALPIRLHEFKETPSQPWEWAEESFQGLYVYDVRSDAGFDFLGRIATKSASFPDWTRGIFIGETVYAVQNNAVSNANINDIANTIQSLSFGD